MVISELVNLISFLIILFATSSVSSWIFYSIVLLYNICYLDCKIYCLICFDKNTKHRRAFSFRDMHKAFNVKIRVTCIISVNKMRCDKWFSLLLPFHLDSTNSYLTISIQIEEKKLHLFWVWFKAMMLGHLWAVHSTLFSRDIKSY